MTRPGRVGLALFIALALVACTDDDDPEPGSSSSSSSTASTISPDDPELERLLLTADDLPDGFTATQDVADTVTTFCAGQDATAGLRADGRAIVGFGRTPAGASVIQVVFRFEDDGATQFIDAATELLTSCSDVPDATGLAFTYEAPHPAVTDAVAGADRAVTRYGTSVGSGDLTADVAAVQVGDLGSLIAVLGVEQPRAALDELAIIAFDAAVDNLKSA